MRVFINSLSVTGLSGRHVVHGFLKPILNWTQGLHEYTYLHFASEVPPDELRQSHVRCLAVPDSLRSWVRRAVWELQTLPQLVQSERADLYFSPAGAMVPGIRQPQVVLCQNPWCYVPSAQSGWSAPMKAWLQRRAYAYSLGHAALMVFISKHLRDLYRAGSPRVHEVTSEIAYPAIDDDTHAAAAALRQTVRRDPQLIVSVSSMAPWKGADRLVKVVAALRTQGIGARLKLVGPWPVAWYEQRVRKLIQDEGLTAAVEITGMVSKSDLHRHYAEARVFCLLSHCESYGIPAAEATAFGTPVVACQGCAIPEICGPGGIYVPPRDDVAAAAALQGLLTSDADWQNRSDAARENASRFHWEECAAPLMNMFSLAT